MREIRMLRVMWRELETGSRTSLAGHEGGNPGYRQGLFYRVTAPAPDPTRPADCGAALGCSIIDELLTSPALVSFARHVRRTDCCPRNRVDWYSQRYSWYPNACQCSCNILILLVGVRRFDGGRPARHPTGRFAVQNRSRRFCELPTPASRKQNSVSNLLF